MAKHEQKQLAGGLGFEPRLTESESPRPQPISKASLQNYARTAHYGPMGYERNTKLGFSSRSLPGNRLLMLALAGMTREERGEFMADWTFWSIGAQIRDLRISRGLTQQAMAAAMGVAQSCISRWQSGLYRGWRISTLQRIAEFFDVALFVRLVAWPVWIDLVVTPHSTPEQFNADTIVELIEGGRSPSQRGAG